MQYRIAPIFVVLVLLFSSIANPVRAQLSAVPDPVQYIVAPETPGPNQTVYIEAQGVGPFIGNATITWRVNGKVVQSGIGLTTFSFTTGGIGSATAIQVTIESTQGTYTQNFVFAPSVVRLVWEADTTTPLFYKGKSLYSAGSPLRVVAFPTIVSGKSLIPPNKLSFQWYRNDSLNTASSGLGKNVFVFNGDGLQTSEVVRVDVYLNGTKVGSGDVAIPATNPGVVLYKQDPLRGILLDVALPTNFNLNANEITLKAEPYYFTSSSLTKGALLYSWTLNGSDTSGPDSKKGLLTLRQTGSGSGSAQVGISVQNTAIDTLTQAAQSLVGIVFGQSSGSTITSLFGL
ncbi:MAG: hypothetical protein QG621_121 [Patescibacteria group bacterium]|nr:hypothetical protein [Patescibacteria group bacterium]